MTALKVGISMDGVNKLIQQFADAGKSADDAIMDAVTDLTLETHANAVSSIQRGPKTGRVYVKSDPSRTHQASAPGEPPATDTGRLVGSIKMELPQTDATAYVGTKVDYGRDLELGTSKIRPRPWLLPAFEKAKAGVLRDLRKRVGL